MTYFHTGVRDDGVTEFVAEIRVTSWGCAAQTYGPAESCFDAEPMECEVVDAWLGADEKDPDAPRITLTQTEEDRLLLDFAENPPEPDDGDDYDR